MVVSSPFTEKGGQGLWSSFQGFVFGRVILCLRAHVDFIYSPKY